MIPSTRRESNVSSSCCVIVKFRITHQAQEQGIPEVLGLLLDSDDGSRGSEIINSPGYDRQRVACAD